MQATTAQRFGSNAKSFVSPATAAAVLGAALIASDTTDTAETAWSPAAACLLPDVLPVAGTLLSYGGNRQLAAGGTVTHGGQIRAVNVGTIFSGNVFGSGNDSLLVDNAGQGATGRLRVAAGGIHSQSIDLVPRGTFIAGRAEMVCSDGGLAIVGGNSLPAAITCGTINAASGSVTIESLAGGVGAIRRGSSFLDFRGTDSILLRMTSTAAEMYGNFDIYGPARFLSSLTCGAITASGTVTTPKVAGSDTYGVSFSAGLTTIDTSRLHYISTLGTPRWRIDNLQGNHLYPVAANTYDVGGVGFEIRNGHFAGTVAAGAITASGNIVFAASPSSSGEIQRNGASNNQGVMLRETSSGAALGVTPNRVDAYCTNGFRVSNTTGSADGPLTCGAITASGNLTGPNVFNIDNSGTALTGSLRVRDSAGNVRFTFAMAGADLTTASGYSVGGGGAGSSINASGLDLLAAGGVCWRPAAYAAFDTALSRNAAGVVEINNGTAGTLRDLTLRNLTTSGDITLTGGGILALGPDRRILCGAAGTDLRFVYTSAAPANISVGAITASSSVIGTGLVASDNAAASAGFGAGGEVRIVSGSGTLWVGRWNQTNLDLVSNTTLNWHSSGTMGTPDFRLARNAAGQLDARGDNGLRIRNLANNADAPLSCSSLVATGGNGVSAVSAIYVLNPVTGHPTISLRDDLGYGVGMNSDKRIVWSNTTGTGNLFAGTIDTSISRISAGVIGVGTGAAGSSNAVVRAAGFVGTGTSSSGSYEIANGGSFYCFAGGTTRWRIQDSGVASVMRLDANNGTTGVCLNVGTADVVTVRNLANTGAGGLTCSNLTANSINQADPFGRLSLAGGSVKLKAQTAGLLELLDLMETSPANLSCGAITASGIVGFNRAGVTNVPLAIQTNATSSDGMYLYNNAGTLVSDFGVTGGGHLRWRFRDSTSTSIVTINTDGAGAAITTSGVISSAGSGSNRATFERTASQNATVEFKTTAGSVIVGHGSSGVFGVGNGADLTSAPFRVTASTGAVTCEAITASGNISLSGKVIRSGFGDLDLQAGISGNVRFLKSDGTFVGFIDTTTGAVTASGPVQETPTQSALNPTTSNIPSGKRQGWYNTALGEFRDWVNIGGTLLKSAAYT